MARSIVLSLLLISLASSAYGRGLLIPVEPDVPPLGLLNHRVTVTLEDQVAVTTVEQTFRNHTDRPLEATYVFPVPEGAGVTKFTMSVDGQRAKGELLKSEEARRIYAEIVRQTKDPALLEYIGTDLLSLKIFPVPPQADQKIELSFTAIAQREHDVVEYVYPLRTDRAAVTTLEEFRLQVALKSQQPISGIYSPTHEVTVEAVSDHEALVHFEENGAALDRDFRLFYTSSSQDVGLTALEHRPISGEDGYVLLLLSPRAELAENQKVPRDIVFVVDTSGSMMQDKKLDHVKQALQQCLTQLSPDDSFGLLSFATTVDHYRQELLSADQQQLEQAQKWVAGLEPGGGTAIHQALLSALKLRSTQADRMFTVVFFTDGQPTIGQTDPERILADFKRENTSNTRVFSFGVGNDLNAVFLDQLAEQTRAVSQYARPEDDLGHRVSSFFKKIQHPVLADLSLSTSGDVRLVDVYPPELPDLFHGDQLVVLGRYQGSGHAAVLLEGQVGAEQKQFVYERQFSTRTLDKTFVEELWARRKVGYLLDQIRINGERQELVDEVVRLAKNYGITTPYTSYLVMPDAPVELAYSEAAETRDAASRQPVASYAIPPALAAGGYGGAGGEDPATLEDFARRAKRGSADLAVTREALQEEEFDALPKVTASGPAKAKAPLQQNALRRLEEAKQLKLTFDTVQANNAQGLWRQNQVSELGVNLAVCTNQLKCQSRLPATAVRTVATRRCMEVGGVWIDEAFSPETPTVAVQAQSDAYFRILERQPSMKEVFKLGNHVLWISPSGKALVVDASAGKQQMSDGEIDALFADR